VIYPSLNYQKPKSSYGKDEEVPIVVFYYFKGKKGKFSTGTVVRLKDWNPKKELPVLKTDPNHQSKNLQIKEVEVTIGKMIEQIKLNGLIPYPSLVRVEMNRLDRTKEKNTKKEFDFFLLLDEFLKSVVINTDITHSTKKTIYSIMNQVEVFIRDVKGMKFFEVDNLDEQFIEEYQWYCVNEKKLSNSTIHSHFRKVRSFVNWCKRRGYTDWTLPKFKVQLGENDIVFLQRDELLKLFQYDGFDFENEGHSRYTTEYFTDDLMGRKTEPTTRTYTNWEVYKDMLVFGCGVGCRFSDLVKLKIDNVKYGSEEDPSEYIRFTMTKTQKEVKIPFNTLTLSIYKKYSSGKTINQYIFPLTPHGNLISNQKFNQNLKELSKVIGLNRRVVKKEYVGREVKSGTEVSKPLYEVISSQIVRRTFIREGINSNLPYHIIRTMSGHTDDKVFQGYFNTLTEEIEKGMETMFVFDLTYGTSKDSKLQLQGETSKDITDKIKRYRQLLEEELISQNEFIQLIENLNL
jgi:site-specific recombinase XerD